MSSHPTVSSSPSHTSTSNPILNRDMSVPYFNETGPIYEKEHVQGKEFVKFVRAHVVVVANKNSDGNTDPRKETAWFDWEAFRTAVAPLQASDISVERDLTTTIPPYSDAPGAPPVPITTPRSSNTADTTIQAVLDGLVARFASTFTNILFVPTTSDTADIDGGENPQTHFFNTLRKNLYHAFTHHFQVSDGPEGCLSFRRSTNLSTDARTRSEWEYRLLFVHSDVWLKTVRGLVMTVTLQGSFEDEYGGGQGDGKQPWRGASLDSRGLFSGALRAMQVIVGEGFRCP